MRWTAWALCLAASASAQQSPVMRSETRVVLVDTIVTGKKGDYVRDLTAKDFHVFQDGKEQPLASFAFESSATPSQPRSLVLFFDESSMQMQDQIPARRAASAFIDAEADANRKIAVMAYDGALHIAQNFTDNAGRLKDALPQPASRIPQDETTGRRRGAAIDDTGARNMPRSLRALADSLGVLPGRKIVVLFVGTLPSSSEERSELKDAIEACNRSAVSVYPVDVRPVTVQAGPNGGRAMSDNPRAGRRGPNGPQGDSEDVGSAYVVDSGAATRQMLLDLANRTGGFLVQNSNDLLGGLQEVASEEDEYYALTFTPPDAKEGSCHTLRVKVDRPATKVRARASYCTAKAEDLLAGTPTGQDLERRAAAADAGDMAASMRLAYFYVGPNVARVDVAMDITPGTLKFQREKDKLHAEIDLLGIAVTAGGDDAGAVRARFSDVLKFDFDNEAQIAAWKTKPLHYEKEFRIAPGRYKFTMAFGQSGQEAANFGKAESPLSVDPWNGSELTMSGLVLSRETHPAAEVGLTLAIGGRTPLIAGNTQVVPSVSGRFAKAGPGAFYLEVYAPDPPSLTVRVRVLDRKSGVAKWDSGLTRLPPQTDGGKLSIPALARLPLESLTPGDWTLEVTAADASGKSVTRTADFAVE